MLSTQIAQAYVQAFTTLGREYLRFLTREGLIHFSIYDRHDSVQAVWEKWHMKKVTTRTFFTRLAVIVGLVGVLVGSLLHAKLGFLMWLAPTVSLAIAALYLYQFSEVDPYEMGAKSVSEGRVEVELAKRWDVIRRALTHEQAFHMMKTDFLLVGRTDIPARDGKFENLSCCQKLIMLKHDEMVGANTIAMPLQKSHSQVA